MNLGETRLAVEQFRLALQTAPDYQQAKENLERASQSLAAP